MTAYMKDLQPRKLKFQNEIPFFWKRRKPAWLFGEIRFSNSISDKCGSYRIKRKLNRTLRMCADYTENIRCAGEKAKRTHKPKSVCYPIVTYVTLYYTYIL